MVRVISRSAKKDSNDIHQNGTLPKVGWSVVRESSSGSPSVRIKKKKPLHWENAPALRREIELVEHEQGWKAA